MKHTVLILFACLSMSGCVHSQAIPETDSTLPGHHLPDGSFRNNDQSSINKPFSDLLKWWWNGEKPEPIRFPLAKNNPAFLQQNRMEPTLTWIGHATLLIQFDGLNILTDPHLTERASPLSFFGPTRYTPPGLSFEELPEIDVVVVSHNHYDHLDAATVRRLAPTVPRWVCPLGVGAHLERWGVPADRITEHDWWDEAEVNGLRLVCTPARHFSGRFLDDRNRTLWCGWAILGETYRVYATGDGGFGPHFAEVGDRLGPFDATLAEIGAYNQGWADVHMGPEQAVRAVQDARGGLLVPVHWGTFNLAFHGWTEPAERIVVAAQAAGVPLVVPRPGEPVEPAAPQPIERWWPEVAWQTAAEAPVVSSALDRGPEGAR